MKVVLSLDFELGWGVLDSSLWRQRENNGVYERMRSIMPELLGLMADLEMPATWALVSSMLCPTVDKVEIGHLKQGYRNAVASFLKEAKPSTWNAIDLCELLLQDNRQEIATHSATHLYVSHEDADERSYVEDIGLSLEQLLEFTGVKSSSIVYPRDQVDWKDAIAKEYRLDGRLNPAFGMRSGPLARAARAFRNLGGNYPLSSVSIGAYDEIYHGGSIYFNWQANKYARLKRYILARQIDRLLSDIRLRNRAGQVCHIWLHPFNLSESGDLFSFFKKTLISLADLRDAGAVGIYTMSDIRSALPLKGHQGAGGW